MNPNSLTDEELMRAVYLDNHATERERVLAERLASARDYIQEIQDFLVTNNLAEIETVSIQ